MGGEFTLSDDSHGARHVGTHYRKLLEFVERIDLDVITIFEKNATTEDDPFPGLTKKTVAMANITDHPIFD